MKLYDIKYLYMEIVIRIVLNCLAIHIFRCKMFGLKLLFNNLRDAIRNSTRKGIYRLSTNCGYGYYYWLFYCSIVSIVLFMGIYYCYISVIQYREIDMGIK